MVISFLWVRFLVISCPNLPIPPQTFRAFAFHAIILFPSPLPFILCPSPSLQSCVSPPPLTSCFVHFDLSQIILSPLLPFPCIAIHWISTTKTSWVIQRIVLSKLWTTGAWGPFLESPETFRAHFRCPNSLCIFKTKAARGMKLCSYFNFYSLHNIRKDQLYRISKSEFYEWLFAPKRFSGLSRNGPLKSQI